MSSIYQYPRRYYQQQYPQQYQQQYPQRYQQYPQQQYPQQQYLQQQYPQQQQNRRHVMSTSIYPAPGKEIYSQGGNLIIIDQDILNQANMRKMKDKPHFSYDEYSYLQQIYGHDQAMEIISTILDQLNEFEKNNEVVLIDLTENIMYGADGRILGKAYDETVLISKPKVMVPDPSDPIVVPQIPKSYNLNRKLPPYRPPMRRNLGFF